MNMPGLVSIVSKFSPLLGASISGPIGGVFVSLISSLFGANKDNPDEIIQKIQSDPGAEVKLKSLEYQHQEELKKITVTGYQAEVDDRKNAREMQFKETKETGKRDWVLHSLAIGFLVGMFIYLGFSYLIPKDFDKTIFNNLLNIAMLIYSFYFGSAYQQTKGK